MSNANGDMPAMPLSGDAYEDYAAYDGTKNTSYNPQCQGLTKRETFAMNAPDMPSWFKDKYLKDPSVNGDIKHYTGRNPDCEVIFMAWPTYYADALLSQLEQSK